MFIFIENIQSTFLFQSLINVQIQLTQMNINFMQMHPHGYPRYPSSQILGGGWCQIFGYILLYIYTNKWKIREMKLNQYSVSCLPTETYHKHNCDIITTGWLCVLSNTKLYHQNLLLWISTKFAFWKASKIRSSWSRFEHCSQSLV